jgi:hypothetical protein
MLPRMREFVAEQYISGSDADGAQRGADAACLGVGFEHPEHMTLTPLGIARPLLHRIDDGAIPLGC